MPSMRKGLFLKCLICVLSLGWTLTAGAEVSFCQNRAPSFDPVASCYLSEPDTGDPELVGGTVEGGTFTTCHVREDQAIEVCVHASDPDGDPVGISVINAPPAASFEDKGEGIASLVWNPEFIGPWSSSRSPFVLFFVASDGELSSQLKVVINVINVNRNPELILPESLQVAACHDLVFQVRKFDPDLEEVTITALNPPPGASFDAATGMFNWSPEPADTGFWPLTFQAADRSGGDCSSQTQVKVNPPSTFSLSVGIEKSILGGVVSVPVNLVNTDPVAGMELLIRFDPTVFVFLEASTQGTEVKDWEYFSCRQKPDGLYGQIKIVGIADFPNQTKTDPLSPDSGAIVYLNFKVTSDPYLSGLLVPLEFHSVDFTDNTLSTPEGRFIPQERVDLNNGGVLLSAGSTLIGDINQNGIPYEVGDAVKLAAYMSGMAALTDQQKINADIDQDGRIGTLGDLVLLIRTILEQQGSPEHEGANPEEEAIARISQKDSGTSIQLESERPVGGAYVVLRGQEVEIENLKLSPEAQDLDIYTSQVKDEYRVLIISPKAEPLPSHGPLFSFEGEGFDAISVSVADCEGELLSVKQEYESSSLPTRYALYQNYPNPFNPNTSIRYFVGTQTPTKVSLKVYNVAGQVVKTLVDDQRAPGEYLETWDGRNEEGQAVASGVYFYRLNVSDYSEAKRMVLLK